LNYDCSQVVPLRARFLNKPTDTMTEYINDIKREVEALLNSQSCDLLSLSGYASLKQSLLSYGITNRVRRSTVKNFARNHITGEISQIIEANEPRLRDVFVYINNSSCEDFEFVLSLFIEGVVVYENRPSNLSLRSTFNALDMRFGLL